MSSAVFSRYIDRPCLTPRQRAKLRNLFQNEAERLNGSLRLRSKPIYLLIDPSFSCQLKCPSCHSDMLREEGFSMRNLHPDVVQRLMDEYGETLIQVYFANWGEPLLHKQFDTLVEVMKGYGVWVTTSTNLSLPLSDERIDGLVRSGIDHMILSIDGTTQESYEQYRRKGRLPLVIENVRRIVAAKLRAKSETPFLRWQFLIFPWNRHQVEDARRLSVEIGCNEFDAHDGIMHPRVAFSKEDRKPGLGRMSPSHAEQLLQLQHERQAKNRFFGCDHLYHQLTPAATSSLRST